MTLQSPPACAAQPQGRADALISGEADLLALGGQLRYPIMTPDAFLSTLPAKGPAVGYAGVDDLDPALIELHLDDVRVAVHGGRDPAYREEDGQRVMKQAEITVRVDLHRGPAQAVVWTCDLSHDYVTINADYRS